MSKEGAKLCSDLQNKIINVPKVTIIAGNFLFTCELLQKSRLIVPGVSAMR
jgi:hypothetical protein